MTSALTRAGAGGLSGAKLRLEKKADAPRRLALARLLAEGQVREIPAGGKARRFVLAEYAPTADSVAARLLEIEASSAQAMPALRRKTEFSKKLALTERPLLDTALAQLQARRQLLALRLGRSVLFLFATPLRAWLSPAALEPQPPSAPTPPKVRDEKPLPAPAATEGERALFHAYRRLTRESGGFPDVKIADLLAALRLSREALAAALTALWREGCAVLSLGDWSLASERERAAAVELAGEQYLLVRLDDQPL